MTDYREPLDRARLERILAESRDLLNSEYADDIEERHAALEELKAVCEELETRLKRPEGTN